jgi:hypothetical protein
VNVKSVNAESANVESQQIPNQRMSKAANTKLANIKSLGQFLQQNLPIEVLERLQELQGHDKAYTESRVTFFES